MIAFLRGSVVEVRPGRCVLDVGGVGYEVMMSEATVQRLPSVGEEVRLNTVESVAMYGGGTTLYGFLTDSEKEVYLVLREHVPGAGAKKALELLDKASPSLADFRRSIEEKDASSLVSMFGFTVKTAEKLIAALHGKMGGLAIADRSAPSPDATAFDEAVAGLVTLGYRDPAARQAAQAAKGSLNGRANSQDILREALKHLSGR